MGGLIVEISCNDRGLVKQRESQSLEFKQSFRRGDALIEYARTLAAMANNQGGCIVFGVKDKPREPVGLSSNEFEDFDSKELNKILLEYFSIDISWDRDVMKLAGVKLGILSVASSEEKPIICIKNHDKKKLREGAIYFRYRGETKEVRSAELRRMLQEEREKERDLWMQHIQSIAKIGPKYAQLVDGSTGEMQIGDATVIIDEGLVDKLKLIKEGEFSEKEGAPTLRLLGDIEGVVSADHVAYTEAAYPHTQATILDELPINPYDFQALVYKHKLKGNPRYHAEIPTGRTGRVQKYSGKALSFLRDEIRNNPNAVAEARAAYRQRQK